MYLFPEHIENKKQLSDRSKDILRVLLYSDIFRYPMTQKEIRMNSSVSGIKQEEINSELLSLVEKKLIKTDSEFYFLPANKDVIVRNRKEGNKKAEQFIKIAFKISRFISYVPFVKGVFLSGSVSKGYADRNSDIDYFIVTEPGRLWITRTLLIMFKKIFLLNSRKYFCLNYFIDADHLEIPDKNFFTAKELSHLIPVFSESMHKNILKKNEWISLHLPNFEYPKPDKIIETDVFFKRFLEKLLRWKGFDFLDTLCMHITE
jgi:predicted nucleotidyltransferase